MGERNLDRLGPIGKTTANAAHLRVWGRFKTVRSRLRVRRLLSVVTASGMLFAMLLGLFLASGATNVHATYHLLSNTNPVAIAFDTFACAPTTFNTFTADAGTPGASDSGFDWVDQSGGVSTARSTADPLVSIAIDPATGEVYFAEPALTSIVTSDSCGTFASFSTIAVPCPAYALAWDPASDEVWGACPSTGFAFWYNPAVPASSGVVSVPGGSNALVYDPSGGLMLVASTSSDTLTAISASNSPVWTASTGDAPAALVYDPGTGNTYVANEAGNSVSVITSAGSLVGTVTVGVRPVALGYNGADGDVFVANSAGNSVTDIHGTSVAATVSVGAVPLAMTYDPATTNMYVADQGASEVSVITPNDVIAATIPTDSNPTALTYNGVNSDVWSANSGGDDATEFTPTIATPALTAASPFALLPANNNVYVSEYGAGTVEGIATGNGPSATPLAFGATCPHPTSMTYAPGGSNDLYASCSGNVVAFTTGLSFVTNIAGTASPGPIAYDPAVPEVLAGSLGAAQVSPISSTNVLGAPIVMPSGTTYNGMVYDTDPANHYMFVANVGAGSVSLISTTNTVFTTTAVGTSPIAVALDTSTHDVWVLCGGSNNVYVLNSAGVIAHAAVGLPAGATPKFITYDPAAGAMMVSDSGTNEVSAISTSTYSVTNTVITGATPGPSTYDPIDQNLYVLDTSTGNVWQIGSTLSLGIKIPAPGATGTYFDIQYSPGNENVYLNDGNQVWDE